MKYSIISNNCDFTCVPSIETCILLLEDIKNLFFPNFFKCDNDISSFLEYDIKQKLNSLLKCAYSLAKTECNIEQTINTFMIKLLDISKDLKTDLEATLEGDPAAFDINEIVLTYPGFKATFIYRIAHSLYELNVPYLPRILSEYAHSITGIDINPGAKIGNYFFIDHGTGIVIGETSVIGDNVKIYQGVTLGALSLKGGSKLKGIKRHPTIENNVTIYANATILGGNTIIGENTVIGANSYVLSSINANKEEY